MSLTIKLCTDANWILTLCFYEQNEFYLDACHMEIFRTPFIHKMTYDDFSNQLYSA